MPEQAARDFLPARPWSWLISIVQFLLHVALPIRARIHFRPEDIASIKNFGYGRGLILTPNHADELDPAVCMELSRTIGRRFMLMCNREAFDEYWGIAGKVFQHVGVFSVERGGHDQKAKDFSIEVVKAGTDGLLIFPEGEIYYLNEMVQPFHTGAIDIGMKAISERRKTDPQWTAVIIPIAIKYCYPPSAKKLLEKRVARMERKLSQDLTGFELKKRMSAILLELLQEREDKFGIEVEAERFAQLSERIKHARNAILEPIEQKYPGSYNEQSQTMDRVFQLSARIREQLKKTTGPKDKYHTELKALQEVGHMVSWQPQYIEEDPSIDRLAEMVLKLEREVYQIRRPQPIAKRDAYVRVGAPLDLGAYFAHYSDNAHQARHTIAETLRQTIQAMINEIAKSASS